MQTQDPLIARRAAARARGISPTTWSRLEKSDPAFPKPLRLGDSNRAWFRTSELDAYFGALSVQKPNAERIATGKRNAAVRWAKAKAQP